MGCQTDSDGRPGLPYELCRSGSLTDGKPLSFEFECLLYPAYGSPPAPTTHPIPLPPPIDSIRVITEGEGNLLKKKGIQIVSRISYEILAI